MSTTTQAMTPGFASAAAAALVLTPSSPLGRIVVAGTVPAGATAPTVGLGAAGVLTGAYTYKVTFVNVWGETHGATSAVVNPAAQQVSLTNIPLGPSGTTARRVYRTLAGGADETQRRVTTIADNTTTTYTDNSTDATITGQPPVPTEAVEARVFRNSVLLVTYPLSGGYPRLFTYNDELVGIGTSYTYRADTVTAVAGYTIGVDAAASVTATGDQGWWIKDFTDSTRSLAINVIEAHEFEIPRMQTAFAPVSGNRKTVLLAESSLGDEGNLRMLFTSGQAVTEAALRVLFGSNDVLYLQDPFGHLRKMRFGERVKMREGMGLLEVEFAFTEVA